eukprot:5734386-Prymnesium_polylepis.2
MFPASFLRFLEYLRSNSPPDAALYFGNNRISDRSKFCTSAHCLLRSAPWLAVARNQSATGVGPPHKVLAGQVSYAQGGFYGFSHTALAALNRDGCMEVVGNAVQKHRPGLQLFEDETVGLCMHLRRVPLVTCACFYDWGPCGIGDPSTCRADTNESRLCRAPLSVHKLRELSWYDGWWRFLASREQASLDALDRWQAAHNQAHARAKPPSSE